MKKLTLGLILVIMMMVAVSCAKIETDNYVRLINGDILGWSVVKSPITKQCYEVASASNGHRYMGMASIDCKYYTGD